MGAIAAKIRSGGCSSSRSHSWAPSPSSRNACAASAFARSRVETRIAAPLWMMARWNRPFAAGIASNALTLPPPPELAKNRDVAGVATKNRDVVVYPAQCGDEIKHAGITRVLPAGAADVVEVQKCEDIQTVVDADHDNAAAPPQIRAIMLSTPMTSRRRMPMGSSWRKLKTTLPRNSSAVLTASRT